mgnify:CR=1 FL=1
MKTPYRDIPEKLRNLEPFTGNSMRAVKTHSGSGNVIYEVYSYDTPIAQVTLNGDVHIISQNYWGPTSGRHINLCHAWLNKRG